MHKIIKSHLRRFVSEHSLSACSEDKQFEHFVNYSIVSRYYPAKFDVQLITTGDDDTGIDGIAVLIDSELATSVEEAEAIFKSHKKNIEAHIVFIQSKSGEKFSKEEISSFSSAVFDFISEKGELPRGERITEYRDIFNVLLENASKISNGKPSCSIFFATTGEWNNEPELEGIFSIAHKQIMSTGYFSKVDAEPVDRDKVVKLWMDTWQPVSAKFDVKGSTPFPVISGVNEAYLAIVPAKQFVETVISDSEGRIRATVFQENVRSFLGIDNGVNAQISGTISSPGKDRFAILNNGVTIISSDVRIQSDTIYVNDFQIVNGCQTCHVLHRNKHLLDERIMLTVKVVEAQDPDVVTEIVRATNSQSPVKSEQFLSLRPLVRHIEQYFDSFDSEDEKDYRLYFERRERQFANEEIPDIRIYDIRKVARSFSAMFLDRPDLSTRYPTQMFLELDDQIFRDSQKEIAYYTSAYILYRLHLAFSNNRIQSDYSKFKWHLLMILKYQVCGKKQPQLTSRKLEDYCQKLLAAVSPKGKDESALFNRAIEVINSIGLPTKDRLKRQAYSLEIKKALGVIK